MEAEPAFVKVFVKLACPFTSGTVARMVAPCLNSTVPVGTIPFIPPTVAVNVTALTHRRGIQV